METALPGIVGMVIGAMSMGLLILGVYIALGYFGNRKTKLPSYIDEYDAKMGRNYEQDQLMTQRYPRCWHSKHVMVIRREWRAGRPFRVFGQDLMLVDILHECERCRWGKFDPANGDDIWVAPPTLQTLRDNNWVIPSPYMYPQEYFADLVAKRK